MENLGLFPVYESTQEFAFSVVMEPIFFLFPVSKHLLKYASIICILQYSVCGLHAYLTPSCLWNSFLKLILVSILITIRDWWVLHSYQLWVLQNYHSYCCSVIVCKKLTKLNTQQKHTKFTTCWWRNGNSGSQLIKEKG